MPPSSRAPFEQAYPRHPFLLSVQEITSQLSTNVETGLTAAQVQEAQRKYGPNKLEGEGAVQWYSVLLKQVSNAMILVLVLAMALSYGVTDYIEGGVITAVIILNVVIGFYQEFQAEKKMDSLRSLSSPSAAVLRDGSLRTISSAEVVPGDVVQVKTGDTIPADLRLFDTMHLECDEKILTGEAMPVAKEHKMDMSATDESATGVGDRLNMAYSSSTVTKGRGRGIVAFTGMFTEIGKIANSMQGKARKPNRSLSRKQGHMQPAKGAILRFWDGIGKFLGLTVGTPLQRKLSKLAYILFGCALILAVIVFGVNRFNVTNEVAIYAISTGIAIIPESLIAVLTITMVVGMTQMRKRAVVIRQLSALEALGGVTNICSDKTGTLTQGQMITRKAWVPGVGIYTVNGAEAPTDPSKGTISLGSAPEMLSQAGKPSEEERSHYDERRSVAAVKFDVTAEKQQATLDSQSAPELTEALDTSRNKSDMGPELEAFLQSTALCNLATIRQDSKTNAWQSTGDPTEVALQVFAMRFSKGKKMLEDKGGWRQLAEYPFDSSIKRMSVIYQGPQRGQRMIFTKGAVERIIELCSNIGIGNRQQNITEETKQQVLDQVTMFANQGLRVLAVARRTVSEDNSDILRDVAEKNLTLLGLAGLYDPPRTETKDAIKSCTTAGIKVHMLTGDHPGTATAIAREVGIIPRSLGNLSISVAESLVKTAAEFDSMSDEQIDDLPTLPLVIARCAPDTKTRMIAALHRRRDFVAMTGDGVNDAPSLKAADVGIAMGMAGSDVAKGASDIVLTDDNFASIVNAIEEGRRMFDNIQKFILHLLTSNVAEVILLIVGLGFQDEMSISVFPLSPLQILWINMLTSSFPAFGLGRERASSEIMRRPPHDNKRGVFTVQIIADMMVYGLIMGACTLLTFVIIVYGAGNGNLGTDCNRGYNDGCDVVFRARASVFAELTWLILISAWEFKSVRRSMFNLDPARNEGSKFPFFKDVYENKFLFYAVVIGALSVFPAVYIPGLNTAVFKHKGITWEWALSVSGVWIFVLGVECWKAAKREFGWYSSGLETKKDRLGLRQGFSSFAKSWTREKDNDSDFEARPVGDVEGGV